MCQAKIPKKIIIFKIFVVIPLIYTSTNSIFCFWRCNLKSKIFPCNKTQNQIIDYFNVSYNKVTVKGAAASRVFFHLKAEAVRMGEKMV